MSEFYQEGPSLRNQYTDDRVLRSILRHRLPPEVLGAIEPDLIRFGERVTSDVLAMGDLAEAQPPRLIQFDPWGRRIDRIEVSQAWRDLDRVSAEEGIVAIGYEREYGAHSRLYQFAKLYLFHPSSGYYTCPLAMTDGAARAIEVHGDDALKESALGHLTSRDPARFWTSGQWMTERAGGSDVGETATVAKPDGGQYRLHGTKWFTSATTSQMAMALARIEGAPPGSKGLSLFYIGLRDEDGGLNRIRVHRLKDKLGTKALPTAELTLEGTPARLVGGEGHGVRKIATLFNVTRVYNACCAVGGMRRALALARDYASKRKAFGKLLSEHPLHVETLAAMQVEFEAALHLVLHAAQLMGKDELGQATPEESAVLRLLITLSKLYTAKQGVRTVSEALEAFGGAGYIEDTGLPRLLRDEQVLAIWEGTTNVLSLDVLRAIEKEAALPPFIADARARLRRVALPELEASARRARQALDRLEAFLPVALQAGPAAVQAAARGFAMNLSRAFIAALMLEHAEWSVKQESDRRAVAAAIRFCAGDWVMHPDPSAESWPGAPASQERAAGLGLDRPLP